MHFSVTAVATDNAVTMLSVATTFTVMCTLLLHECEHRCQLSPLSQCCQCHHCHTAVSCHQCHARVHSNVTALSLLPCCQFTSLIH